MYSGQGEIYLTASRVYGVQDLNPIRFDEAPSQTPDSKALQKKTLKKVIKKLPSTLENLMDSGSQTLRD